MSFWRGRRRAEDVAEEIETHLSLADAEYRRRGLSERDARDAAQRALGGALKTRHVYAAHGRWQWLDAVVQDTRVGLRVLVRDRAFALTAIIVLGLGIGVNNMQFTIIYTHTLRPLPMPQPNRVLMASFVDERGTERNLSYAEYQEVRAGASLFEGLAALGPSTSIALGDAGRAPDRYLATYTTANALDTLHVAPLIGRAFTRDEERLDSPRVAILGAEAWRARYQSDPGILGRDVLVNGLPTTVVGVIDDRSGFPSTAQVLLPIARAPSFSLDRRDARVLRAFGRVSDTASVDEAQTQLRTLLTQAAGVSGDSSRGLLTNVTAISTRFRGRVSDPAWIAFLATGFLVVAVASANAANLMIARGVRRTREIAIRGSLGASRGRIVTQLLVESMVLAALGGAVGAGVSSAGARLFQSGIPENSMPYWFRYSMDTTVLLALVLISFATVVVFGLVPAFHTSKADVTEVLKDGGWSGARRLGKRRLTTTFMAAQLGLSVVLLSYVVMNFVNVQQISSDAVVRNARIVTGSISLPADRYRTPEQRIDFLRRLDETMRAIPGVSAASITSSLPRTGANEYRLQKDSSSTWERSPTVWAVTLGPRYFEVFDLSMRRGREFSEIATAGSSNIAIISQRFAEMFFPAIDPIGQDISLMASSSSQSPIRATVVGVAQNIRHRDSRSEPVVYLPLSTTVPTNVAVMLRSDIDTGTMTTQLRTAVLALDPNLPVFQTMTMERVIRDAEWVGRVSSRLVTALSLIVLLLSAIGLYAITAHSVSQRSKEIGIRMAVGAGPREIHGLILKSAAVQVLIGLAAGLAFAMAWDGVFFSGRVDAKFADPRVLGPVALVLASAMFAACLAPLRRATGEGVVAALRRD